mgnify:CR=1 FL=1
MNKVVPAMRRFRVLRHLQARPRLWFSVIVGTVVALMLPDALVRHSVTRALLGWNAGALLYLALVFWLMWSAHPAKVREQAQRQDEGRNTILLLVSITMVAVLAAIAAQLAYARETHGLLKMAHVGLAALTVATAWLFVQTIFALHYAHEYQLQHSDKSPSLLFPGTEAPDYFDFLYVACIIGTSGQTADVSFASRRMRRVGLLHCVLAFVFNTTLLALTINIAAGLI